MTQGAAVSSKSVGFLASPKSKSRVSQRKSEVVLGRTGSRNQTTGLTAADPGNTAFRLYRVM